MDPCHLLWIAGWMLGACAPGSPQEAGSVPEAPSEAPAFVDTDRLWARFAVEGKPGFGVRRCRTPEEATPEIVWFTVHDTNPVGVRTDGEVLVVDGVAVGGTGGLGATDAVVAEIQSANRERMPDRLWIRTREELRFTRLDGADLLVGRSELRGTFLCDRYAWKPRP